MFIFCCVICFFFFFFQAEDGIRDRTVTGVQTCALPIFPAAVLRGEDLRPHAALLRHPEELRAVAPEALHAAHEAPLLPQPGYAVPCEIGRASCRERV